MTHKDIYTKFMIEYDKANVTSSYPSLTEYEIATILDKAYNALIAQKITGNNVRRSAFESDLKSISDLQSLITVESVELSSAYEVASNVLKANIPSSFLYYIQSIITSESYVNVNTFKIQNVGYGPEFYVPYKNNLDSSKPLRFNFNGLVVDIQSGILDKTDYNFYQIQGVEKNGIEDTLVMNEEEVMLQLIQAFDILTEEECSEILNRSVDTGELGTTIIPCLRFHITSNIGDENYTLTVQKQIAPMDHVITRTLPTKLITHQQASSFFSSTYNLPWIKIPVCYIEDGKLYVVYDPVSIPKGNVIKITYIKQPNKFVKSDLKTGGYTFFNWPEGVTAPNEYQFECNDTVAEELISLAVAFALENVESARLNAKLNMRGLEA